MYEATPIEQAYSLYIAHQIFNNDCNNALMSIHIPGRVAVPFLTQSGIDRSILKTIWSVADPQNVGTLTTINQFRILLRLVAMAQAGILQIHHSNSEMNGFLIQPQQQQQQQFPLPVFSNVMMPQHNQLMSMYGHLVVVNNNNNSHQSSAMMTGNNNIASDVTSTATTDNFTSASATTITQQSIGDAFGALVEVQDVPLGGFQLQSAIDNNNNNNNNNNNILPTIQDPGFSTDFQDPGNIQRNSQMMATTISSLSDDISFSGGGGGGGGGGDYQQQQQQRRQSLQQEQQLPVIPDTTSITTATAGAGAVSDAFSDFGPTSNSPLPALHNQTQSILTKEQDQNDDDDDDDDDFGGFSTAPPVAINSFGGGNDNGTTMNISDAFGDVVSGIQDAPLPPLDATLLTTAEDQNNNNDDDDDDDDDFGGFSAAPSAAMDSIGGESGNGTTMNVSDAFGGTVLGIQDVPLPPLTTVEDQNDDDDDDDDDDFGGFSAAPSVPMDSIGGESGNGTTLNISDAFGDTVLGIQDAPLPPLTTVEDQNDDDDDDDDDDDFGGFSAAPSNRTTMIIPDAFGDASTAKEQDENGIDNIVDEDDDEDDFGGFSATSSVAVDSIGGINSIGGGGGGDGTVGSGDSGPVSNAANIYQHQQQQQQPFMTDFGRALSEPVSSGIPSISTVTDAGRSLSLDPFGDLAPVENAPLPSLDAFANGIDNIDQSEQTKQATTTALSAEESNRPLDSGSDIFGIGTEPPEKDVQQNASFDKEETEDGDGDDNDFYAPSSSLGTTNETPTKDQTSLGLDVTETGRSLSITDAFDDMLVQQDTSLPSLEVTIELNINDQNKDNEKEYEAVTEDVSLSISAPQMDVTETGRSLSITDAFDEMLVQQDTALPSLEMMNEPNTEDQSKDNQTDDDEDKVEEWGVFEEAVESTNSVHEEEDEAVTTIPTSTLDDDDDDDDDDDWGDFDQAPVIEPQAPGVDFDAMPTSQSQISVDTNDDAGKHQNPLPEAGSDNDEDDWGAFDEAPTAPQVTTEDTEQGNNLFDIDQAAPNLLAEQNCSPLPEEGSDSNDDDWGAFDEAPSAPQVTTEDTEQGNNLFDIDQAAPNLLAEQNCSPLPEEGSDNNDDDWGAFDEAPSAPQVTAEDTEQGDNLFGINQAAPNLLAEQDRNEEGSDNNDDDWGAFDEAPSAPQVTAYDSDTIPKSQSQIPESNDDFGVFLDAPAPNLQSEQPFGEVEIQDDTGSIALTLESEQPKGVEKEEDKNDEDFGDWGRFDAAPTLESEQHKESKEDDDNDDENNFGNFASNEFKNVSAVSTENDISEEIIHRDRIRSLALQLPECLLRKSGVSGEHIDLGEAFEVNIGMKSSMDECCKRRVARCIEVLESLTSTENSKLASTFWVQIFNVVNEELEQAKSLLDEAKSLSPGEWNEVRAPFSMMLRGLSEYMRVTRSIVASIGDILLLDESAMLTVDTWASTWCSLSVLEKAISCEKAWKDINKQVTKSPLTVVTAVSIEEIRSHANDPKNDEDLGATNRTFCRLTLQPLKENDKETTKAEVSFQGRQFMACSANFLVNRCPFFVVGDEV